MAFKPLGYIARSIKGPLYFLYSHYAETFPFALQLLMHNEKKSELLLPSFYFDTSLSRFPYRFYKNTFIQFSLARNMIGK